MATFDDYLTALRGALNSFADSSFNDVKDAAIKDGEAFINQTTDDLTRWTSLLGQKQLTADDFDWLVLSKKDLLEMKALEEAGLAQAALDRFTNGLINLIVSTALKVFVPA